QRHFEHIILVIQENRTPDNLFGASGLARAELSVNKKIGTAVSLNGGPDLNHSHASYLSEVSGAYLNEAYDYVTTGAEPYWDIAAQYGFANRMFQTNQGPSYPAHQFLLSGTSSLSDASDVLVSDNHATDESKNYGCSAPTTVSVPTLAPDGSTGEVYPCF